ncbi:MAG: molybdenum cofactor biosynthesis protein MoaE [Chitinophagaceae bacterium]
MKENILITENKLDVQACIGWVSGPDTGGIAVFIGTVRNETKGREVLRLEFEAYGSMALREMKKIASSAMVRWPVKKLLIHHRTGMLAVGEIPVIIAVSAAHRDAAFDVCRFTIDTLKETVPIWKKEVFADGEVWVAAHP